MSYKQDLTNASYQAANNAARIDQAIDHLLHELHTLDGYPTQTSGADNPGPRGQRTIAVPLEHGGHPDVDPQGKPIVDRIPVTAVEDQALKRQTVTDQLADIVAHTRGILTMHLELAAMITTALGTRVTPPEQVKRCDATGREGYLIPRADGGWSDLNCQDLPIRGSLCAACYHRERRYRINQGLPTREEADA